VTAYAPGDKVFGFGLMGTCADYILFTPDKSSYIAKMPDGLSFQAAASLPAVGLTNWTGFTNAGDLRGKTVFVPAGLSGTGSLAVQMAKRVYGAGKVVTTVSTAKIPKLAEVVGDDVVDQIVDYTKEDVVKAVGVGKIDFLYETMHMGMPYLATVKPKTGVYNALITVPPGEKMKAEFPDSPWIVQKLGDLADAYYKWRAGSVTYWHVNIVQKPGILDDVARWVMEGKVRPVIGEVAKLDDLQKLRAFGEQLVGRKGYIGKFVIEM